MSLLSSAVDLVTSGGLTGIITGGIGAFTKIKEMKIVNEQRRYEMNYEVRMHKLQFESDKHMADQELLITKQAGEDAAFTAAIQAEGRLDDHGLPWGVRACRTLFRPFLTMFMWAGTLLMAFSGLPVTAITEGVAMTFQQGASAGTGFWFGSRAVGASASR